MKENNKPTVMDQISLWWSDLELGVKIAISWLGLVAVAVITLAFLFPIFGLILLGIVVVIGTIGAIAFLLDY